MRSKSILLFFVMILLTSCAAPTPQATVIPQTSEVSKTSEVLTKTPTSEPTLIPTLTQTPEPTLPAYGVIDPNVGEKLRTEGINIPEELKNPEYKLDLATEYQKTEWGNAYGIDIPITVIPEKGIAYGKYHIKGIGATQEAWNEYAKQHIKYMWIHYREYGNEADRDITLEQYVELLKAGRGGFEIPQYNPKTGFFDLKATVNPVAGYVKVISDNKYKELPTKLDSYGSGLFYVDENGMVWVAMNDLEYRIEKVMDPKNPRYKTKPYLRDLDMAFKLVWGSAIVGIHSNTCLASDVMRRTCVDEIQVEDKYLDSLGGPLTLATEWLTKYEAGDYEAEPPVWIED